MMRVPSMEIVMSPVARAPRFYGRQVVAAAFVLAVCGWGMGFYGPPIYLDAVRTARGWSLAIISAAVTMHFLAGALVVANLPALYRRFGLAAVTKAGGVALAAGVLGWALAGSPWQLFAATIVSGAGWAATGGAAVNAIVSPWFVRTRPVALAMAYNGASIGGVIFSPLWVAAIGMLGFPIAAAAVGIVVALAVWVLAEIWFARAPSQLGLAPDGDPPGAAVAPTPRARAKPLPRGKLWRRPTFLTLAAGMALGLFAQIGLIAHLFSLMAPALGAQLAGLAMGAATAAAIAGRTLASWLMSPGADRRVIACASYAVQIAGSLTFIAAAGTSSSLLLLGVLLFGFGIGNATSLPPLIAQAEFADDEVPRVVSLIVAISQAAYAFAPAAFGLIRELAPAGVAFFAAAAVVQGLAIATFLAGRGR
jgi:hypothetical protein